MEKKGTPKAKKAPAKKSPAAATPTKTPAKSPAKPPAPKVVKQDSAVAGRYKSLNFVPSKYERANSHIFYMSMFVF
jgi:hypothetical protein